MDMRLIYTIKRRGLNKRLINIEIKKCNELINPKNHLILI